MHNPQVPYNNTCIIGFKSKVKLAKHHTAIMCAIMDKKDYSRDKFVLVELFQNRFNNSILVLNYIVMEIENILRVPFISDRINFDVLTNVMITDLADTMKFIFVENEKITVKSWSKKTKNTTFYHIYNKQKFEWLKCMNPDCGNMTVPICNCCEEPKYCSTVCLKKHKKARALSA